MFDTGVQSPVEPQIVRAITVAVKRSSNTSRTRRRSISCRRASAATASSSVATMKPVSPWSTISGTSRNARRSPACRRPWPRSSPGRTVPASRSGTAAPGHCREMRTSRRHRSRRQTRPGDGPTAARRPRGSMPYPRRQPWRRSSAAGPRAWRSRWHGRAFLGRDPAEESEVGGLPGRWLEGVDALREPMRDGGQPVRLGQGCPLVVGN